MILTTAQQILFYLIGTTQQLIFDGSNKMMKIIHIYSSNSLPQHLNRGVHHKAPTNFVNDFIVLALAARKISSRLYFGFTPSAPISMNLAPFSNTSFTK